MVDKKLLNYEIDDLLTAALIKKVMERHENLKQKEAEEVAQTIMEESSPFIDIDLLIDNIVLEQFNSDEEEGGE